MSDGSRKWGPGTVCLVLFGVFESLIVLGALLGSSSVDNGGSSSAAISTAHSGSQPRTNFPVTVTAVQLEQAFARNEAAAQKQYGDRHLLVSGTISKVKLQLAEKPFVVFEGASSANGPQARLDNHTQPLAADMLAGQWIKFICEDVNEVTGTPILHECHLYEVDGSGRPSGRGYGAHKP